MKIWVKKYGSEWQPIIQQGCQQFRLDYSGNQEEARWMAKMFRKALKAHDLERESTRQKTERCLQVVSRRTKRQTRVPEILLRYM